jgi:hypothetical protein
MRRIFILSPAKTSGERASLVYSPGARFDLSRRLRGENGAPLGEVFSFLSGLYFRGKYVYATRFASPPQGVPGVVVITSNRGLLPPNVHVTIEDLRAFSGVPIDPIEPRYLGPLVRDAHLLAEVIGPRCEVVLLGSVSTNKYVEALLGCFGQRLMFPLDFVGRGDMSRGGLLLRRARSGEELPYVAIEGAIRRGKRPPKLERLSQSA